MNWFNSRGLYRPRRLWNPTQYTSDEESRPNKARVQAVSAEDPLGLRPDWQDVLKRRMDERRYSARSLSLAADLSETVVNEWFRKGKQPSFASLAAVAAVLKLSLDELLMQEPRGLAPVPTDPVSSAASNGTASMTEVGPGQYRLLIDKVVPRMIALQIMGLLPDE